MMSINLYYDQVLILQTGTRRPRRADVSHELLAAATAASNAAPELADLGPAVRRTGRRVLRTKSRVLSNSSLSDIFSHAHASYLVATSSIIVVEVNPIIMGSP